jgi:hypothetical protein
MQVPYANTPFSLDIKRYEWKQMFQNVRFLSASDRCRTLCSDESYKYSDRNRKMADRLRHIILSVNVKIMRSHQLSDRQPAIHWVPQALFPAVKRSRHEAEEQNFRTSAVNVQSPSRLHGALFNARQATVCLASVNKLQLSLPAYVHDQLSFSRNLLQHKHVTRWTCYNINMLHEHVTT